MADAIVNALIAGALTLIGVALGAGLTRRLQRRAEEKAARDQLQAQAEMMVRAVMDIRMATAAHDSTWTSRKTRLQVLGIAVLEILPGLRRREAAEFGLAMARSAGVVWEWNLRGLAAMPKFGEPYARLASAAFQLTLWPNTEVPVVTRRLSDAVLANAAAPEIERVMAEFRTAIVKATTPSPRRSWRPGRGFGRIT